MGKSRSNLHLQGKRILGVLTGSGYRFCLARGGRGIRDVCEGDVVSSYSSYTRRPKEG